MLGCTGWVLGMHLVVELLVLVLCCRPGISPELRKASITGSAPINLLDSGSHYVGPMSSLLHHGGCSCS